MRVLDGIDGVMSAVGAHLGPSAWLTLTRQQVDEFSLAVGSNDATPFLVLSLTNYFLPRIVDVRGFSAGINYGTDEIRFPAAVLIGARLRGSGEVVAAQEIAGGLQTRIRVTIDTDSSHTPVCVVDALSRWIL
jgi:hypothetical protein